MSKSNKLRNAVYGFAVGDALGVPYEFKQRGTFRCTDMIGHGTWGQPAGTWSDDTSMLLATCDSIRERGKIDLYDIMNNFILWRFTNAYTARGEVFDVGGTTEYALQNYKMTHSISNCSLTDEMSNGNGSLMRILPLAFCDDVTEDDIKNVSALTHGHDISKAACVTFINITRCFINDPDFKLRTEATEDKIKSSGYVVDTLGAALWCVATTNSYRDCVLKAVNLGEDTDTVAAIAGGLAGIKYGYDAIPAEWLEKLANKALIEKCLF